MRQTLFTMSLEVQPRNLSALRRCILDLRSTVEKPPADGPGVDSYDQLAMAVPGLHFGSIMIFEDDHYDPQLTVELNVDGDIGTFLPQVEVPALQPYLRQMVRCCKRPSGQRGAMYDAITAEGSKLPLAPFLETCVIKPAVFHQGNRGLDRDRILAEKALFAGVQEQLKAPALYAAGDAQTLHRGLRAALLGKFPWLTSPEPERWSTAERIGDYARLIGFVVLALACLSAPGMILALLMPAWVVIAVSWLGAIALTFLIPDFWSTFRPAQVAAPVIPSLPVVPSATAEDKAKMAAAFVGFVVGYLIIVALILALPLTPFHAAAFGALYKSALCVVVAGLLAIPLPVAALLLWVRWLELRDPVQEDPHDDAARLQRIAALEDQIAQNHMGSVVLVKPGVLRSVVLRAGLCGLGLVLRVIATNGYLASMRTIHFAHWAVLNDGARLAFFSNFDSSWESYLDDFIEKAHGGLTLAWTNGVGFPETRFLVFDGASSGRLFKAWARHSMAEGLFWFSAYKDLSVNQIERQYRIAKGLRQQNLSDEDAKIWACDL
jgi:hypothetical protein